MARIKEHIEDLVEKLEQKEELEAEKHKKVDGIILLLTDCFSKRIPHREMFMAYCFGPLYILLGISYLIGH